MPGQMKQKYFLKGRSFIDSKEALESEPSNSGCHIEGLRKIADFLEYRIKNLTKDLHFEILECNLPKDWPGKIITLIERNEDALVLFPKGLLTKEESKRLEAILKTRQEKANQLEQEQKDPKEIREENAQLRSKKGNNAFVNFSLAGIGLGLGLSIAFAPALLSLTSLYIFSSALFSGVIAGFCRDQYLNWSAHQYQAKDIDGLKNEGEKEAIASGIEAKSWPGYFRSFGHYQAYKHPVAFACGLQRAQEEDADFTNKFKVKP